MIPLVIVVQHHILHQKVPVLHHMMLIPEQVEAHPIIQSPNQMIVCVNSITIGPVIIIETSL